MTVRPVDFASRSVLDITLVDNITATGKLGLWQVLLNYIHFLVEFERWSLKMLQTYT